MSGDAPSPRAPDAEALLDALRHHIYLDGESGEMVVSDKARALLASYTAAVLSSSPRPAPGWTKERPTTPGAYWLWPAPYSDGLRQDKEVVTVFLDGDTLRVGGFAYNGRVDRWADEGAEWLGPLSPESARPAPVPSPGAEEAARTLLARVRHTERSAGFAAKRRFAMSQEEAEAAVLALLSRREAEAVERCAKVCDGMAATYRASPMTPRGREMSIAAANDCAAALRALPEKGAQK